MPTKSEKIQELISAGENLSNEIEFFMQKYRGTEQTQIDYNSVSDEYRDLFEPLTRNTHSWCKDTERNIAPFYNFNSIACDDAINLNLPQTLAAIDRGVGHWQNHPPNPTDQALVSYIKHALVLIRTVEHPTLILLSTAHPNSQLIERVCKEFNFPRLFIDQAGNSAETLDLIKNCEFLIADLSDESQAVYFYLGYARYARKPETQAKPIVLCRDSVMVHIEMDVLIRYQNTTSLENELRRVLGEFVNQPLKRLN